MFLIGKVLYSQLHSLLPREASIVTVVEERSFDSYDDALEYCRKLRVGGDYTFVPVEVDERLFLGLSGKKSTERVSRVRGKGKRKKQK